MRVTASLAPALAILLASALGGTSVRTTQSAAQDMGPIGVIDVQKIFANDPAIKAQVETIKNQLKAIDTDLKARRTELTNAAKLLKTFKPGSDQYDAQEEKVAGMESKLRLDMKRKRDELQDAEAKVYYDNYKRIVSAVERIAQHYKVKVVMRFNSDEMEAGNNESVLRGITKSVIYYDPSIDMTPAVMQLLNQVAKR